MNGHVVSQEEVSRLDSDLERIVQGVELCICKRRVGVHGVSIINIHDNVKPGAICEVLPEVARIIFGLSKLLDFDELVYKCAIPDAACVGFAIERHKQSPAI